jgi:hypothetical protein
MLISNLARGRFYIQGKLAMVLLYQPYVHNSNSLAFICMFLTTPWHPVPIGALTTIGIGFLLHIRQTFTKASGNAWQVFFHFDPIGNTFFISAIICLLLALHWGGDNYPYSNGRIIALFVLFGLLLIGFVVVQVLRSENATGKVSYHVAIRLHCHTYVLGYG